MELGALIRPWIRRLPLILLLGALCGVAAWLAAWDDPKVYEQQLSFVVRPNDQIPPDGADRVAVTLANRESAITQSIVGLLDSEGLPPGPDPSDVERTTTLRPGSTIVDVEFAGGDPAAVSNAARLYLDAAPRAINRSYPIYELEPLTAAGAPTERPSTFPLTLAVAVLLGFALGVMLATLEQWLADRRRRPGTETALDTERLALLQREPPEFRSTRADS